MKRWICPSFDGLLDLAQRDGVDIRPTLLRVLTDSYIAHDRHTPEEERQYTELTLRLIDECDIATRAAIAARLASYPAAPRSIILQLARDVLAVAEPVLRHSSVLTAADREAITGCHESADESLFEDDPPPVQAAPALAPVTTGAAAAAAVRVAAPPAPAVPIPAKAADEPPPQDDAPDAVELCELFFAAGGPERRLILLNLDYAITEPAELSAPFQRADIWRFESAALRHETETVMRELQRALGVSARQARRIVEDELGEPIAVAAKAMNMPTDVLHRVLLFLNFKIGQSVDRVYQLADLYTEISVVSARRLVAIWREADPEEQKPARHRPPARHPAAESARRALIATDRVPGEPAPRRDIISMR